MSNNLIDVQQMKNVYNTEKHILKLGLLNIRSLSTKALFLNDMITDHKLDMLSLTETCLKPDEYIILNESTPQDFNIHVDNEKDALGSKFIDILNSIGVRQHVSGPTHCRNHTLDLILSHGIDVNGLEILQQSDDISDHYLVLC